MTTSGFCLEDWDGNPDPRKVGIVKKSTIPDTWDCCGSVIVLNPTIPAEPLTIPLWLTIPTIFIFFTTIPVTGIVRPEVGIAIPNNPS